jgi:hypothetical protein
MTQTLNGITVNKLTLAQYKSAKASSSLKANEVYVISDIDEQLENLLVYKESLDVNNPIILRSLESGLYKIYGYFKYNSNQSGISGVDPFAYVIIEKGSSLSYATIIDTTKAVRYSITDTTYQDLDDTGWINLAYVSGYSAGTATQLQYRCKNNMVTIRGGATGTFASGSYVTVNKDLLPSKYRPQKTTRGGAMGASMRPCGFEVNVDGTIKLGSNLTTMPSWIAFCVTYPI